MCDWHRRLHETWKERKNRCRIDKQFQVLCVRTHLRMASLLWMFPCNVGCCCWLRNLVEMYLQEKMAKINIFSSYRLSIIELTVSVSAYLCTWWKRACLCQARRVLRRQWVGRKAQLQGTTSPERDRLSLCPRRVSVVSPRRAGSRFVLWWLSFVFFFGWKR